MQRNGREVCVSGLALRSEDQTPSGTGDNGAPRRREATGRRRYSYSSAP